MRTFGLVPFSWFVFFCFCLSRVCAYSDFRRRWSLFFFLPPRFSFIVLVFVFLYVFIRISLSQHKTNWVRSLFFLLKFPFYFDETVLVVGIIQYNCTFCVGNTSAHYSKYSSRLKVSVKIISVLVLTFVWAKASLVLSALLIVLYLVTAERSISRDRALWRLAWISWWVSTDV